VTSQAMGSLLPSATPEARGPRKEGQFCALAEIASRNKIERVTSTR